MVIHDFFGAALKTYFGHPGWITQDGNIFLAALLFFLPMLLSWLSHNDSPEVIIPSFWKKTGYAYTASRSYWKGKMCMSKLIYVEFDKLVLVHEDCRKA